MRLRVLRIDLDGWSSSASQRELPQLHQRAGEQNRPSYSRCDLDRFS